MVADVIESYLENIEEREFDAPFMALLRAVGFYDIHFLHGSFEFGKDFIAKRYSNGAITQFAFQTKAGDIALRDWNACRGQIDMLRTDSIAHPSFDRRLDRRAIFVTTGRLVGAAAPAAQQYADHLASLAEIGFETWDRERIVELIANNPEACFAERAQGDLLALMGQIDQRRVQERDLERYSRAWVTPATQHDLHWVALEAALIAQRLRLRERIDLACFTALLVVRTAWARTHGAELIDSAALLTANTGRQIFSYYGWELFSRCGDDLLDPLNVIRGNIEIGPNVTYPVRCLRLLEILGLLGLLGLKDEDPRGEELATFIARFLDANPGSAHPISDRWAVSMIPPVLSISTGENLSVVRRYLQGVIKWVADRYDSESIGLAPPDSSAEEELEYLLGDPFEHVKIDRRAQSYIATVVLDLAAMLRMGDLFELAMNEFLAVELLPVLVEVPDTSSQYLLGGDDIRYSPHIEYSNSWTPIDGWKVSAHHVRARGDYYLPRINRWWDHLALSAVLRDRHFLETCRHFLDQVQNIQPK